eukprot:5783172-Amphidinium_carterae.1
MHEQIAMSAEVPLHACGLGFSVAAQKGTVATDAKTPKVLLGIALSVFHANVQKEMRKPNPRLENRPRVPTTVGLEIHCEAKEDPALT